MKKHLLLFTIACTLLFLGGCQSSHKVIAQKTAQQPQFIDNVYIAGHNKSNATADAITPKRSEPKRTVEKPRPQAAIASKETASISKVPIEYASYKHHNKHKEESDKSDEAEDNIRDLRAKYAGILGVRTKDLDNAALYQFIDRWYGTNYRLGGCDISGIDCSGFVQKLYSEVFGIDLVRTAMDQFSSCKRIKRYKDAEEGDLVFFKTHGKKITHVGIYLANDYFVHASTSQGVIISNLNEEYWHRYFAGAGRVPRSEQ